MERVLRPISPVPVFPAELQQERAKHRIESYDVARSVAVIGMVVVNYASIFHPTGVHGWNWLVETADFLAGRAASLFIMLAGIGIGPMAQGAFRDNDHAKMSLVRYSLLKRSFFLLVAGFCLMQFWGSDILHFYALYLVLASWLLFCRPSTLMSMIGINFLVFSIFFYLMQGEVELPIQGASWMVDAIDEYFLGGLYAVLPWGTFMLIGFLVVRSGLIHDRLGLTKAFFWALAAFLGIVVFRAVLGHWQASTLDADQFTFVDLLYMEEGFPITPLFFLSSTATSIMVITTVILLEKVGILQNLFSLLKDMGRFTLTIYIAHILLGQGVRHVLKSFFFSTDSLLVFQMSVFVCLIVTVCFAKYWARHFRYGPLEWLMRYLTCTI